MPDINKVSKILQLEPPTMVRELQSLLRHVGFYKKFIRHYADKVASMIRLLQKQSSFNWDNLCHNAFLDLKKDLTEATIFVTPNWDKEFHVHVDASAFAIDSVSCQPDEKDFDHPNYYATRQLSAAKKKYTTTEHEALGMTFAVQNSDTIYLPTHLSVTWIIKP